MKLALRLSSPIVRATYQAAFLSGCSNILAQFFQAKQKNQPLQINPLELLRFVVVTFITCPPNFHWQQFLERNFPAYHTPSRGNDIPLTRQDLDEKTDEKRRDSNADPASTSISGSGNKPKIHWRNTFLKMFIDCVTVGALVNTVAFLVIMGLLKGHTVEQLIATVQRDTFRVIFAGYKLWPMVSLVSFTLIPVDRRVVFFSAFGLLWNVYMSLVAAAV